MAKWNLTDDYVKLEGIYIKKLLDIVSSYPTNNGYIGEKLLILTDFFVTSKLISFELKFSPKYMTPT